MNEHLYQQYLSCPEDIKQSAGNSLTKTSKNKKRKCNESDRSDIIDDSQTTISESDKNACALSSSNENPIVANTHKHSVMSVL